MLIVPILVTSFLLNLCSPDQTRPLNSQIKMTSEKFKGFFFRIFWKFSFKKWKFQISEIFINFIKINQPEFLPRALLVLLVGKTVHLFLIRILHEFQRGLKTRVFLNQFLTLLERCRVEKATSRFKKLWIVHNYTKLFDKSLLKPSG